MSETTTSEISPFRSFTRSDWARRRADTPLTLTEDEVADLSGISVQVSLDEVEEIYLPLSRLLSFYVESTQGLFRATQQFLGGAHTKVPYIIGMGGSVAVGKSTTARVLRKMLARWPNHPQVDLLTTDGFLHPNAVLEERGIMNRKGFPESYDVGHLLRVLSAIKAGQRYVEAPVYSHLHYDVSPKETVRFDQPDILIVEGINVLQVGNPPAEGEAVVPFVSDFFDFSIYIDADEKVLRDWYITRFFRLRETAFRDPESYFHRYSKLTDEETRKTAGEIWDTINLVNLRENVKPTSHRADLILRKGKEHEVEEVFLRKL